MKKHNVGVVGYNRVATAHLPAINDALLSHEALFAAGCPAGLG
jgi:predicted dehydrogenase